MSRQIVTYPPAERPDIEVEVDGTWCPGDSGCRSRATDGTWSLLQVQ